VPNVWLGVDKGYGLAKLGELNIGPPTEIFLARAFCKISYEPTPPTDRQMDNLSWSGQPLKQFLGESRNSEDVIQVRKGLVQAEKHVKVAELRQQLERLIQRQNVEYDRTFNAEILKPPLSSELAAKLFHKLGEVGMVLYGYIHHKEGLEIEVLALDEEILAVFIDAMDKFLKAQRECRNKSIRGIDLWLEDRILNACSGTLVLRFIVQLLN
jgi:hypothetical protein